MSIKDLLAEMYGYTQFPTIKVTEESYSKAGKMIKEMADTNWSKSKKLRREACRKMTEMADMSDVLVDKYMCEMDKYSTELGNKLMQEMADNFIEVKDEKEDRENKMDKYLK